MSIAEIIKDAILVNILDRKGLKQAWEACDEDIQEEIEKEWVEIIKTTIVEQL